MYKKILSEKLLIKKIYNFIIFVLYVLSQPFKGTAQFIDKFKLIRIIKYYLASSDQLLIQKVNDINFIVNLKDRVNSKKIYINKEFPQFPEFLKAMKIIKLNNKFVDSLVDIGSHYGNIIIPAMNHFEFSKGIAIEPINENFKILNANITLNNLHSKVDSYQLFVGSEDDTVKIRTYKNNSAAALVSLYRDKKSLNSFESLNNLTELNIEEVVSKRLKNIDSISLLKSPIYWIYAQGEEFNIVYGSHELFDKNPPLVIAYAPLLNNVNNISEKDFAKRLIIKNYTKVYNLHEDEPVSNKIDEEYFLKLKNYLTKTSSIRLLLFI